MKFLELKDCPHCGTRVLPTSDSLCPNCRHSLSCVAGVQVEITGGNSPTEKQQGLEHDAKCPICGLLNPAGTITCDCGYDFDTGSDRQCRSGPAFLTWVDVIVCILFPIVGIIVGIVRLIQGKRTAGKMIGLSLVVILIVVLLKFLFLFRSW